jgi:hypothetical protein
VPLVERAIAAQRQGATETVERLCLDVLELAPDRRPGALSVMYEIRKMQGNAQAAEAGVLNAIESRSELGAAAALRATVGSHR